MSKSITLFENKLPTFAELAEIAVNRAKPREKTINIKVEILTAKMMIDAEPIEDWLPIESVPRDGTVVDLWHVEYMRIIDCWWHDGELIGGPAGIYSHWRPITQPTILKPLAPEVTE